MTISPTASYIRVMADRVMVSLRLSPGGLAALDAAAAERGVGRSEAFRQALAQWLTGPSYKVPEGKVLVSKADWEELCEWRRAEDEGNQFPPPLAEQFAGATAPHLQVQVSDQTQKILMEPDVVGKAIRSNLVAAIDRITAESAGRTGGSEDQTLITESWGRDKQGRRVWTGPVDADGNPVGEDGA